jgi:hypothetical protein
MTTILTATGRTFDLADPKPSMVCIEDVAHHLSTINRYTGAAKRPISDAEHSLLVCEILERDFGVRDPLVLRAGQMHDAHEAYLNDVVGPFKRMLRKLHGIDFAVIEQPIKTAVEQHFGIERAAVEHKALIKMADNIAYATETRDLMPPHDVNRDRARSDGVLPVTWIDLNDRDGMDWTDWRLAFLDRHAELALRLDAVQGEPKPQGPPGITDNDVPY